MPWTEEDEAKFAQWINPDGDPSLEARAKNTRDKLAARRGQRDYYTQPKKPEAPKERSNWRRFMDSIGHSVSHYGAPAYIARQIDPLIFSGDPDMQRRVRDTNTRQERQAREEYANTDAPDTIGEHAVELAGGLVAGATDPTSYVGGFGKNVGERIVNAAGVNVGLDAAQQVAEIGEGVRDQYDPVQGSVQAAIPVVLGGTAAGVKAGSDRIRRGVNERRDTRILRDSDDFIMPVDGRIISEVGRRKAPKAGASTNHGGLDLAVPVGTPVRASTDGVVTKVGRNHAKRGNWVEVDYGNGYTSRYLHLSGFKVKPGDTIGRGQIFGRSGKSGNVTGPHLHWSMMKDGQTIDPRDAQFGVSGRDEAEYVPSLDEMNDAIWENQVPFFELEDGSINQKSNRQLLDEVIDAIAEGRDPHANDPEQSLRQGERVPGSNVEQFPIIPHPNAYRPNSLERLKGFEKEARTNDPRLDDILRRVDDPSDQYINQLARLSPEERKIFDDFDEAQNKLARELWAAYDEAKAKLPKLDDARKAKTKKKFEEDTRRVLKQYEDNYWATRKLLDLIKEGHSPISIREAKEIREESNLDNLLASMERQYKNSKLVPLGKDILDDIKKVWDEIELALKASGDPVGTPPRVPDSSKKFVGRRRTPVNTDDMTFTPGEHIRDVEALLKEGKITAAEAEEFFARLRNNEDVTLPLNDNDLKTPANEPGKGLSSEEIADRIKNNPEWTSKSDIINNEMDALGAALDDGKITEAEYGTGIKAVIQKITALLREIHNNEEGSFRPFGGRGYRDGSSGPDQPSRPTSTGAAKKLLDKIKSKEVRAATKEQKELRHAERSKRAAHLRRLQEEDGGLDNYFQQMGAMKGELPKADFESIAKDFTEADYKDLFTQVNKSNLLPYQKPAAQSALMNLLGAEGGKLPTPSEIRLLSEVFAPDFIEVLVKNRPLAERMWHHAVSAANLPRALMASADVSAPFRQGLFLIGQKEFWKSFSPMFKALFSEDHSKDLIAEIKGRPSYELMERGGLAITDPHKHFLLDREEDFMSDLAEKIPGWGRVVKASNRAYSGFLNRLRADYFDSLLKQYKAAGIDLAKDRSRLRGLSRFINSATGRGDLGKKGNAAAPFLNTLLFSPRLIKARLDMFSPMLYAGVIRDGAEFHVDPIIRKEAWKNLLSLSAAAGTTLSLASLAGMDVELDPRDPDFAKAKIGNTRYDILGGFQQYIKLGSQILTHEKITGKGEEKELAGGFNPPAEEAYADSLAGVIGRFLRSKESPQASAFHNFLEGKNVIGEPVNRTSDVMPGSAEVPVYDEVIERIIPMAVGDVMDAYKELGAKGIPMGFPAFFGVGVQTYDPTEPREGAKTEAEKEFEEFEKSFSSFSALE